MTCDTLSTKLLYLWLRFLEISSFLFSSFWCKYLLQSVLLFPNRLRLCHKSWHKTQRYTNLMRKPHFPSGSRTSSVTSKPLQNPPKIAQNCPKIGWSFGACVGKFPHLSHNSGKVVYFSDTQVCGKVLWKFFGVVLGWGLGAVWTGLLGKQTEFIQLNTIPPQPTSAAAPKFSQSTAINI